MAGSATAKDLKEQRKEARNKEPERVEPLFADYVV